MQLSRRSFGAGLGAIALGGVGQRTRAGATETLRLAHPFPASSHVHEVLASQANEMRESSDFLLDIEVHEIGTLGAVTDLFPLMMKGVLDFALLPSSLIMDSGFGLDVLGRSDLFSSFQQFNRFLGSDAEKAVVQLLEPRDIHLVGATWFGAEHVISQRPVYEPNDLSGLKLRLGGASGAEMFFRMLGASPIRISSAETFEALQRGLLDGTVTSLPMAHQTGILKINRALLATPVGGSVGWLLASRRRFRNLDPYIADEVQDQLVEAMRRISEISERQAEDVFREAEEAGYEITSFDVDEWMELRNSIQGRLRNELPFEQGEIADLIGSL